MAGNQIFVPSAITCLVARETADGSLDAPHADLRAQRIVDLLDNVGIFHDELE